MSEKSTDPNWTIRSLLAWASADFKKRGVETARLEAEILLSHVLEIDRIRLIIDADRPLTAEELEKYKALVIRRRKNEPVAYLTGHREFFGLDFITDPRALIPRPDTEILVEVALGRTQELDLDARCLDLCTGTGCVLIALAKRRPTWQFTGIDISASALALAQKNAARLGAIWGVRWILGDLFQPLQTGERFDLITANPPYIKSSEMESLSADIRDYEPRLALDGGSSGLDYYARITELAENYLSERGMLCLEIGFDQAAAVSELLKARGFSELELARDYGGRDRVLSARRAPEPPKN